MVFKFEGMRPMSLMLQQIDLPEEPAGLQSMFMSKCGTADGADALGTWHRT